MTSHARQVPPTTDPAERARFLALSILDRAPRSAADLRARLIAKDVTPDIADALIERYVEVGLLDDAGLAARIARTRHAERGLAPMAIAAELRRKGFGDADVQAALEPLDTDSQRDMARELAAQRLRRLAGLDQATQSRRLMGYLGRKGYSPSLVAGIVRDLVRFDTGGIEEADPWTRSQP